MRLFATTLTTALRAHPRSLAALSWPAMAHLAGARMLDLAQALGNEGLRQGEFKEKSHNDNEK